MADLASTNPISTDSFIVQARKVVEITGACPIHSSYTQPLLRELQYCEQPEMELQQAQEFFKRIVDGKGQPDYWEVTKLLQFLQNYTPQNPVREEEISILLNLLATSNQCLQHHTELLSHFEAAGKSSPTQTLPLTRIRSTRHRSWPWTTNSVASLKAVWKN